MNVLFECRSWIPVQIARMNRLQLSFLLLMTCLLLTGTTQAAMVDTISVYSASMQKNTRCVVIVPEATTNGKVPVLYLLHGFGGDHRSWLQIKPELPRLADEMQMMIVCPNGARSWYLDSPVDANIRYETYMTQELLPYIDSHYSTLSNRSGRAIAGLSMGGFGSLSLAIRHPDLYGTVCATSGSVNLLKKTFTYKYRELILGSEYEHQANWSRNSILTLAGSIQPGELNVMIDCGTEDEWLEENRKLHEILLDRKVPHDFVERPGAHDADYWNNSIDFILLYVGKHIARK
jgi:S-formylglutathione hydrolase FrmB